MASGNLKANAESRITPKAAWAKKNNSEQVKKIDFLRELDQLEKKLVALEREKATHIYSKRSDFRQDYYALEELETKSGNDRKNEKARVCGQLEKMRTTVNKFQHQLRNVKPTPEFVEKLKETMEDTEAIINAFKEQQRTIYEELMKEEKLLLQEVTALEKRFESWAQLPPITIPQSSSARPQSSGPSARNANTSMPPEVAAFERFLKQTGGHRGGWDEYDHGTFMKIRNKHKGKAAFLDEAAVSLPGRDMVDVKCHEGWCQEYTALLQSKKDAIQKWRLIREAEKGELMSSAGKKEEEEKEAARRRAENKAKKMEEEKKERYARLNAWKVAKELEKADEEERRLEEEQRRAQKQDMERQRKLEEKARVQSYVQQRKEEELVRQLEQERRREEEAEEKRRAAAQERVRFLERDRKQLEGRLARERAKEEAERKRKQRLERMKGQVEVEAKRDPSRLYQLTAGWKERQRDTSGGGSGPVLHIPHRAVPSWRAGPS